MKPIEIDSLEKNMFITIVNLKKDIDNNDEFEEAKIIKNMQESVNKFDFHRLKGDVLQIKAIDLPFIVVDIIGTQPQNYIYTSKIDIRDYKFRKLSSEYIKAMIGNKVYKKLKDGKKIDKRNEIEKLVEQFRPSKKEK